MACGKTHNAEAIRAAFGLQHVIDDFDYSARGLAQLAPSTLVLTSCPVPFELPPGVECMRFDEVMRRVALCAARDTAARVAEITGAANHGVSVAAHTQHDAVKFFVWGVDKDCKVHDHVLDAAGTTEGRLLAHVQGFIFNQVLASR